MIRTEIISLVQRNELRKATDRLIEVENERGSDSSHFNELIMISGRQSALERDIRNGLIGDNYANTQQNQIRQAILHLIDLILPVDSDTSLTAGQRISSNRIILFIGASPKDLTYLRINEEIQKVKDRISSGSSEDRFLFEFEPAAGVSILLRAIRRNNPEILHFSGHGSGVKGISLEGPTGEEVLFPQLGLKRIFEIPQIKSKTKCVLLNACYSVEQAKLISSYDILVIGTNMPIGDTAAIDFSEEFYAALADGSDYRTACSFAKAAISVHEAYADAIEMWFGGERVD